MDKLKALKESLIEEQYGREPLAASIMLYLNKSNPSAYSSILKIFEQWMDNRLEQKIEETLENEDASTVKDFNNLI